MTKRIACAGGCGIFLANKSHRKTDYCRRCVHAHIRRCPACGRVAPSVGAHACASVDLKPSRHCVACEVVLRNTGWERYSPICGKCGKKRWRDHERAVRAALKAEFGGKCQRCGYSKCQVAIVFHHVDDTEKYVWNVKGKTGASLREVAAHPERFELICMNCHFEIHHPDRESPE